jgi:hypothetical protein
MQDLHKQYITHGVGNTSFQDYKCKLRNQLYQPPKDVVADEETFANEFASLSIGGNTNTKRDKLEHSLYECNTPPKSVMNNLGFKLISGQWEWTGKSVNK